MEWILGQFQETPFGLYSSCCIPVGRQCLNYGLRGCGKLLAYLLAMQYPGHGNGSPDAVIMTMVYQCDLSSTLYIQAV